MNLEATIALEDLQAKMAEDASRAAELAGADDAAAASAGHLRDESAALAGILDEVRNQTAQLSAVTGLLDAGFGLLDGKLDDVIAHLDATNTLLGAMRAELASVAASSLAAAAAMAAYGNSAAVAATKTNAATAAANNATKAQQYGHGWFRLTAQGWHWLATGITEFLAVAVPGTVALGAGLAVMAQGSIQVYNHMKDLYEVTSATNALFGQSVGSVLGLSGAFEKASRSADPVVYQILGESLDTLRERSGALATAGLRVADVFDGFMAKVAYDFSSAGPFGKSGGMLAGGVTDLTEFGQVLGNAGHAVEDFAGKMPGMAELLLRVVDGVSRLIVVISELPTPLIEAVMVFHELNMWGGLAVGMLGRFGLASSTLAAGTFSASRALGVFANLVRAVPILFANLISSTGSYLMALGRFSPTLGAAGLAMRNFGADMADGLRAIPMWQAGLAGLAVAGLAAVIYFGTKARTATMQFADSLEQAAQDASNLKVLGVLSENLSELGNRLTVAKAQVQSWGQANTGIWNEAAKNGGQAAGMMRENLSTLDAAYQQNETQMKNVLSGAQYLSKTYGTTFTQSLALADAAQVKLASGITGSSQAAEIARQKIAGLVSGYKAMAQAGGALGTDMAAMAVQSALAATKVSSLNQALDAVMQNATGLTSTFSTMNQDITEIGNNGTKTGQAFQVFSGTTAASIQAAAASLKSFSGTGAQVWQNYDQALSSAQQYTDQLRTSAALNVVGQKAYTQQIAYTVQQLLPYAKYSQAATAQLSVLAQEAGGPATSSYKQLKNWTDQNTESSKKFAAQTNAETVSLSNVDKLAAQFAQTLNSDVQAALNAATVSSTDLTGAAKNLNTAWNTAHETVSGPVKNAFQALYTQLFEVYHNTGTAKQYADAYAKSLGLTGSQVNVLNRYVEGLIGTLNRVPRHVTTTIEVNGYITGSATAALAAAGAPGVVAAHAHPIGTYQSGAQYVPRGVAVVGEHGAELLHFAGGESVTPNWRLPAGGGGGSPVHLQSHVRVSVDGRELLTAVQNETFAYNRRNGPSVTGSMAPPS